MTRRDTIMAAALINAGLLVILFVSALKNEDGREAIVCKKEEPVIINNEVAFRSEAKRVMGDEVDQVLKQYTQQDPLESPVEALSLSSAPLLASAPTFVDDLKSITKPSLQAPSEPKTSIEPSYTEVKVKKGDVLEKIARQNHTTVSEIMSFNHLSSTQLKIGQIIKIPGKAVGEISVKPVEKTPLDPTSAKYYIVKSGDNPWTIAVKNHVKVEDLLKLNNMNEEKARKLRPGDKIRVQ